MRGKPTTLILTQSDWEIIDAKADALYPGKGRGFFIQTMLRKYLYTEEVCLPCIYEASKKIKYTFDIPVEDLQRFECLRKKKSVCAATLVSNVALKPFLSDK